MPPYYLRPPRAIEQEIDDDQKLAEGANATPPLSHWPPIAETPLTATVGPPNLPQTVGTSFKTVTYSESLFFPPDSMGDVGPTQVVVHLNGRIRAFDKAGGLGPLDVDSFAFWTAATPPRYPGDPQIRYDRLSGRWFLLAVDFMGNNFNNDIMLAVSSGPTITGLSSFTFYSFPISAVSPPDYPYWCDYPSLGVDANALYVGCNMYSSLGAFQYSLGLVIQKSSAISGGPLVVTPFSAIGGVGLPGPFAPRGVDNDDPSWTEGYFIGTDAGTTGFIHIRRISDPGGTPTLGADLALPVSSTNMVEQQALGSQRPISTLGNRLHAAAIHKNKITGISSLWTAQDVETDATCTPSTNVGAGRRIGARWYEIGSLTANPTITQFGTLCTTAPGNGTDNSTRGFIFPTVAETGQGHMALSASYASATEFIGIAAAGRLRTDPAGGTRVPETIVLAGLASYEMDDSVPRNRWGDYSFTDVDPNDDQTIWTFQEYADTPANNWSVRAVQLKAPPPPNLAATSNPVCVGVVAAPVNVNGADSCAAPSCTNGLCTAGGACPEFFDPGPDVGGPGFANHISATVTGGITVNTANIIIPTGPATHRVLGVALSLNTTAATTGIKTVSITNPDGQTKSAAIISVIPNRSPVSNAGGPYSACRNSSVVLNGTGSTDPDAACGDSIVSYDWDLNNDGVFDVTGATPTVTAEQLMALGVGVGSNTIKLKVTDTHGATNTASATLAILADGSACSDGDACTQMDICQSGVCVGSNPVICTSSDPCHVGTCDPGTGTCLNPSAPDGTACSDGNACTTNDSCSGGACVGGAALNCNDGNPCTDDSCAPATGCVFTNNTTGCDNGNPCTTGEVCSGGVCQGGTSVPAPSEVQNVAVAADKSTFSWSASTGATQYDVVRGSTAGFPVGPGGVDEFCFDNLAGTTLVDSDVPAAGSGFWYLSRGESACDIGTFGNQSDGTPRSTTTCP